MSPSVYNKTSHEWDKLASSVETAAAIRTQAAPAKCRLSTITSRRREMKEVDMLVHSNKIHTS
jgi:hypothetical protein